MYKSLFNINLLHDFYTNGICQGLDISPTPECKMDLKNQRMLLNKTTSGFKVYYDTIDEAGTPLISISDITFSFIISVKDYAKFLNITDLTINTRPYNRNKVIYYKNDPKNTKLLSSSFIDYIKPKNFVYTFPKKAIDPATDKASFQVLDSNGTSILGPVTSIEPNDQGYYSYKIDFTKHSKGKYTFITNYDTVSSEQEIVYIDNYLATQKIFGLIDISYSSEMLAEYDLQFSKRVTYWKYLVVNRSGNIDLSTYKLEVKDTNSDKVGPYNETYTFSRGPEPDPVIRVSGYDTIIFKSVDQIPFYEIPVGNIALVRIESSHGNPEETPIILNLPNPKQSGISNANNEAEIFVFI